VDLGPAAVEEEGLPLSIILPLFLWITLNARAALDELEDKTEPLL